MSNESAKLIARAKSEGADELEQSLWSIIDKDGLGDVPSDIRGAVSRLVMLSKRAEAAESALAASKAERPGVHWCSCPAPKPAIVAYEGIDGRPRLCSKCRGVPGELFGAPAGTFAEGIEAAAKVAEDAYTRHEKYPEVQCPDARVERGELVYYLEASPDDIAARIRALAPPKPAEEPQS